MKHSKTIMIAMILACVWLLGGGQAAGQTITEIIDFAGDGAGHILFGSTAITVDALGNVYVTGGGNVFKITPGGEGRPGIGGVAAMRGTLLRNPARADLVIQRSFGVARFCRVDNAVCAVYERASGDSNDLAGPPRGGQRSLALESRGSSECNTALRSDKRETSTDRV